MARDRVQVGDLAPPEAIRPSPIQSDTFAAPAQPLIDNNGERLERALGMFSSALGGLAQRRAAGAADAEKLAKIQHMEQVTGEYNAYRSAVTNGTFIQDIKAGKVSWASDPLIGSAVRKDWAGLEAESLGARVDMAFTNNELDLADPDLEKKILEMARPGAEQFVNTADAMAEYRKGLDKVRDSVAQRRQKFMADGFQATADNMTARNIEGVLDAGVLQNASPEQVQASLRQLYKDLGPRAKGGSLDQPYGRTDTILLNLLEQKAKDPRFAEMAVRVIHSQRVDPETGQPLGALSSTIKNDEKVRAIEDAARRSLSTAAEDQVKAQLRAADLQSFKARDGSFSVLQDFKTQNGIDPSKEISVTADTRRKQAVQDYIAEVRTKNGGKPDFDREIEMVAKNGVPHPEWIPLLKDTFYGAANTNVDSMNVDGPTQAARIQQASNLYMDIVDRNSKAVSTLPKEVREFYEGYATLVRVDGQSPDQAAASMARIHAADANNTDPEFDKTVRDQVKSATKNLNLHTGWFEFEEGVKNGTDVSPRIERLAYLIAKTRSVSPDDAVELAKKRVLETGFNVNGYVIFDQPGFDKADKPFIERTLEGVYKQLLPQFRANGSTFENLGVAPNINGELDITENGLPVMQFMYDASGKLLGQKQLSIKAADINKMQIAEEEALRQKARRAILGTQEPGDNPNIDNPLPGP